MHDGKATLPSTGKQASEISSEISHKPAPVHLKTIPVCALELCAQEEM